MNRRCLKFHYNLGRHDIRWDSFFNRSDVNFLVKLGICLFLLYIFEENFNRLFVQVCHIIGFIFVNFMLIVYFQPIKQTFSNKFNVNSLFYIDFACFVHSQRLILQVDQNLYILMLLYTHCFGVNSLELFFLPQKEGL